MSKEIALFGGSFNPPGIHHRRIAESLSKQFDEVIIVPCGPRPDKLTTNDIAPLYRSIMADIGFRGLPNVRVELFDLEQATFTRTHELQKRFEHLGRLWHVVGSDLTEKSADGLSFIQRVWELGPQVWEDFHFAVVAREGHVCVPDDLPPKHKVIHSQIEGDSTLVRERLFRRQSIAGLVTPDVEAYIKRHGLYRGRIPARSTRFSLAEPRVLLEFDHRNPKAVSWAESIREFVDEENPNCIVVFGGDGTMLHAIRKHWRRRLPIFGVNAGHLGFLLNNADDVLGKFPPENMVLRQLPLIYVEMQLTDGHWVHALAFNDAWVERSTGQSAWLEIKVNGQVRLPKMVCDGALVSTAAGSTAYAQAMGCSPLLADTPALLLVGSNVMSPRDWTSIIVSQDVAIEFRSLSTERRPLRGFVDGVPQGEVVKLRARLSRIAAVELAFLSHHDMAEKIAQIQFPTS